MGTQERMRGARGAIRRLNQLAANGCKSRWTLEQRARVAEMLENKEWLQVHLGDARDKTAEDYDRRLSALIKECNALALAY